VIAQSSSLAYGRVRRSARDAAGGLVPGPDRDPPVALVGRARVDRPRSRLTDLGTLAAPSVG